MKKVVFLLGILLALILLNSCQTLEINSLPTVMQDIEAPVRAIPVDVPSTFISAQELTTQLTPVGNLLANPGFEFGSLDGWTACEEGGINLSSDAFEGSGALEVIPGNCFYQSVGVTPDTELNLSCYSRLLSGNGWTGMGLGFADSSWNTIGDGVSTVITGNSYQRYDVTATAPANTTYVSMWFYSDNPAVVDNCSLLLGDEPPPPPPPSSDNLLDNGDFEILDASNKPVNWVKGCGGVWESISTNLTKGIQVSGGACVDQSLSAEDVAALSGNDYTLSCFLKQTGGYTAVSIFLDGEPKRWTRATENTNLDFEVIEVKGIAGQISSGFVSIYSSKNATDSDNTKLDYCKLTVDEVIPPSGDNLLLNGDFESLNANNKPNKWVKGCGGSWTSVAGRSGKGLNLQNGVCVDQALNSSDLSELSGKDFTYSCYAKNTGGYASMTIFLNGQPESVVIPVSNSYQLINLTGTVGQVSSGFVSIYSEAGLTVDDCNLEVEGSTPPQPIGTAAINLRNQVKGDDFYASNGPFTFEVAVRNSGDVTLLNVDLKSDKLNCDTSFLNLAVDEIKTIACTGTEILNPTTGPFTHTVTATATTADGRVVTDSDAAGYTLNFRPSPKAYIDITANKRIITAGSDVTFYVTVGNGGNVGQIIEVTSNVASCNKQFSTSLGSGDLDSYTCIASNVQEGFIASATAEVVGAYTATKTASFEVVIEDTLALEITSNGTVVNIGTPENPEPYSFEVDVRNSGAVSLSNVQVTSDVIQACNEVITNLAVEETKSYTCEAPTLAAGQRILQKLTAIGTSADGRQTTDSDTTEIYRQSDVQLDVSIGAEGTDTITVNSGDSLDVVITLKNAGFVDFNNIQSLYIWRPNPYDGTICQNAIPFSGIGDPDIAFDLAVGETKTFTCTLSNITADVELNLVAYLSNTNLASFLPNEEVFGYDPDKLLIKVN